MKKITGFLLTSKQEAAVKQITSRFRGVLMGKDFKPMPSYWALVPVKQVTHMNKIESLANRKRVDY